MSSERNRPADQNEAAQLHEAVRYGIALGLGKAFPPAEDLPQRFYELVIALQKAEEEPR